MRILSNDELELLAENAASEEARIWSEIEGRAPEMSNSDIDALSEVQESWDQIHAAAVELQEWRAGRRTRSTREELQSSWCEGVDDAINVLRGGAIGVALRGEEEWSRERSEYLRSARLSIITASALRSERDAVKKRVAELEGFNDLYMTDVIAMKDARDKEKARADAAEETLRLVRELVERPHKKSQKKQRRQARRRAR